jgi:hypothetical protein
MSGPVALDRYLSPGRSAWIVNQDSYADASAAVSGVCAQWGGGADLLIPATPRAGLSPMWEEFLYANAVDATATRDVVPNDNLSAAAGTVTSQTSGALLVAVLARRRDRDNWAACFDPSTVPVDNPWQLAYVACQGLLPPDPTEEELRSERIIPGTTIRDMLEIDSVAPNQPGAADLLDRVYRRRSIGPIVVTMSEWAVYPPPEGSTFHSEPPMPIRYGRATRFNGNIVVVYTPGDVVDLCTAWNLRAIYGHPAWAPLAVPATEDVVGVVAAWMRDNAFAGSGFRPVEVALVSHSVSIEQLEELAAGLGDGYTAVPLDVVLRPGLPLSRHSSEIAVFDRGHARLPVWTQHDRTEIARLAGPEAGAHFTVRFTIRQYPIPPVRALSVVRALSDRAAHSGVYARNTGPTDVADVVWPHGWLVLSAACADAGLVASPSTPGHVAAELLRRMGGWNGLLPLLDERILRLLQHLAQRRGMSWFKGRLNVLRQQVFSSSDPAEELQRQIADLSIGARADEDLQQITMDPVRGALDNSAKAAEVWLTWAEQHQLLHRGVPMRCTACRAESWTPLAEMAPPVTCRRCGRSIERPYGPRNVVFQYRASEHLLSVLEMDSLPHLLAGRFLIAMFGPTFGSGYIYGVYPGVTLRHPITGRELEADVVALLNDGSLVPGECKRTAAGLKSQDLSNLDELCELLGSPWSFIATPDPADACGDMWRNAEQRTGRQRFVFTGEHLLATRPAWTLDGDPLRFGGDACLSRFGQKLSEMLAEHGTSLVEYRPRFEHRPPS